MPSPLVHGSLLLVVRALIGHRAGFQVVRARPLWFYVAVLIALWAPDVDFVASGFISQPIWGHGGATHSFVTGLAFGVLFAVVCRISYGPALPMAPSIIVGIACAWSHVLLDAATHGRGVRLLWPFVLDRFATVPIFYGVRHSQPTAWRLHLITLITELMTITAVWLLVRLVWRSRASITEERISEPGP